MVYYCITITNINHILFLRLYYDFIAYEYQKYLCNIFYYYLPMIQFCTILMY